MSRERLRRLGLEPCDLVSDGDGVARLLHCAQLLDLGLEFGNRFFEVEVAAHLRKSVALKVPPQGSKLAFAGDFE